jgi:hypothetical protein
MIIKLSKEEIEQAVIAWVALRMDFDYQEHDFNTVEMYYGGCEVSWVKPVQSEPEAA